MATLERYIVDHRLKPHFDRLSRELRDLADDIDRKASHLSKEPRPDAATPHTDAAARVQQQIMSVLSTLGLEGLASDAAEADVARAKGE